jgi:hypothetical protein
VLLLVSLTEERAIYLALELDRSWTEMTEVHLALAKMLFGANPLEISKIQEDETKGILTRAM